jgi:hypothetical protein
LNLTTTELKRWNKLFILLSLDGIIPLYGDFGLYPQARNAFVAVLRDSILANRRQYEQPRPPTEGPAAMTPLPELFIGKLAAGWGQAEAAKFQNWARQVFLGDHAEQPDWSAWEIVFSQWAYGNQHTVHGLAPERREILLEGFRKMVSSPDADAKIRQLKTQPLSAWDLDMYSRHGFDNFDEFADPYSAVGWMIRIRKLQEFVGRAVGFLSETEKTQLREEGQRLLDELGVWMPGPLKPLDDLWRTLCW